MTASESAPPSAVEVELTGELDLNHSHSLHGRLHEAVAISEIVFVDMRNVTFVDSTILGVLVTADAYARSRGTELVIRGASSGVLTLMRITGLDGLFRFDHGARPASDAG